MVGEKSFSISAKSCTLKYNQQEGNKTIFGNGIKYIIPIYQRAYPWNDMQIRKLLSDLFSSYWGNERNIAEEPIFIGTMQLSAKNCKNEQYIIDGQQRLTTFLLLFKVLKNRFPQSEELKNIDLVWLKSEVNNGNQQILLDEMLNTGLEPCSETLNPYLKNTLIINEIIEEEIKNDDGKETEFDVERFVKHLLSNVYFVLIELPLCFGVAKLN